MTDKTVSVPQLFVSNPVQIEAWQFWPTVVEAHLFDDVPLPQGIQLVRASYHKEDRVLSSYTVKIDTLEGETYKVEPGDWIIKGIKGEFYPCKPDIFAAKYRPISVPTESRPTAHEFYEIWRKSQPYHRLASPDPLPEWKPEEAFAFAEAYAASSALLPVGRQLEPIPIDGKFGFKDGKIVNLVSGQEIPEDEPLFLLRGRDHYALEAIHAYQTACVSECNDLHNAGIQEVREKFCRFQAEHPERMKQPGITQHLKLAASLPLGESTPTAEEFAEYCDNQAAEWDSYDSPDAKGMSDYWTEVAKLVRTHAPTIARKLGVGESREPLPCHICGTALDPNWLNCPKCEGQSHTRVCNLCKHSLTNNSHGFDQGDAWMKGDKLVHSGTCTYCKECNPKLKESLNGRTTHPNPR